MTTHLSARLAWHDRGWDGHVCDAPHLNTSCIIHEHIRDSRDDAKERQAAGEAFADLQGWLPPCLEIRELLQSAAIESRIETHSNFVICRQQQNCFPLTLVALLPIVG